MSLYDMLFSENLSKQDIKKIKQVAVDLLQKVKAKIAELDHWTDKQETKATIDNLIRDTLWAELPECYDELSISNYLDRSKETVTEAKALSSKELEQIITEPLLSSSRVLEGMFYKGVVATEADADTAFYQRLFQKVGASDEIHFLNTPGKQALKKVIAPYQKLGIKFAIIADADVIREDSDMKALLHLTSDEGKKDRIQQERAEVLGYFQSQSKYDKLVALHDELQALALQKLPSTETNADDIDAVLSEYRAKLKKLRDETDDLSALKEFGRDALPPEHQGHFDCLCRLCSSIGLFVVWVGELESWLVDYGVARTTNKPKWIAEALTKVYDIKYDSTKNIWKFVDSLRAFLIN